MRKSIQITHAPSRRLSRRLPGEGIYFFLGDQRGKHGGKGSLPRYRAAACGSSKAPGSGIPVCTAGNFRAWHFFSFRRLTHPPFPFRPLHVLTLINVCGSRNIFPELPGADFESSTELSIRPSIVKSVDEAYHSIVFPNTIPRYGPDGKHSMPKRWANGAGSTPAHRSSSRSANREITAPKSVNSRGISPEMAFCHRCARGAPRISSTGIIQFWRMIIHLSKAVLHVLHIPSPVLSRHLYSEDRLGAGSSD